LALRLIEVEDSRSKGGVGLFCRIVKFPERLEYVVVTDNVRIKFDLHSLAVVVQIMVGRITTGAAGIADFGIDHAMHFAEGVFGFPEVTESQNGRLERNVHVFHCTKEPGRANSQVGMV
jgi:hypothetical protein